MNVRYGSQVASEPTKPPVSAPGFCPSCRSTAVTTKAKAIDESTYWRCTACGEIWNPGRHNPASAPLSRHSGRW
jgi:ribosomal protein L37AE/L43A